MSKLPLTIALQGPRDPTRCQACGERGDLDPPRRPERGYPIGEASLIAWLEYDEADRPTDQAVVLCRECSDRLVEPHPRLYAAMPVWKPALGLMAICVGCAHRTGLHCFSPLRKNRGGPGLKLEFPAPDRVHFRRVKPARSGWETIYSGPATECSGKEAKRD